MTLLYAVPGSEYITSADDIRQADSIQQALDAINRHCSGFKYTELIEGQFSEADSCWVRSYQRIDTPTTIIDGIECTVSAPGTHPGGKCWWLKPVETVYVPDNDSIIETDDE